MYNDETILRQQYAYQDALAKYNRTLLSGHETRARMLLSLMAEVGESCTIDTPVHANWGLRHVHFGRNIYCNAMVSFVDDADIYIGDDCMIGPGTVFATAGHPVNPRLRELRYVYNLPICVGRNVWSASGVQIMPGITIGNNSVIGTHDRKYFYKNFELDFDPELEHLPL